MLRLRRKNYYPIYVCDAAPLRKKSEPVKKIDDELLKIADRMVDTMFAANGLGLAAPQVGLNIRMVALAVPANEERGSLPGPMSSGEALLLPKMPLILVNPQIITASQATCDREEGCLSIPELYAPVTRPESIMLHTQTLSGESINIECGGLLGRAIQHEIDHLDGILFIDRLSPEERIKIKVKWERLKKKYHSAPYWKP